jgi:hypothetical protein
VRLIDLNNFKFRNKNLQLTVNYAVKT